MSGSPGSSQRRLRVIADGWPWGLRSLIWWLNGEECSLRVRNAPISGKGDHGK